MNFSLYFIELLFAKITKQPEWRFVNIFYCSTNYFGKNTFNFCSIRFDDLINFRLQYFVSFASCFFYDAWNYFSNLVDTVSASKCKVVPTQESPTLTISLFPSTLSTFVPRCKYVIPCNFKFLSIRSVQYFYPKTYFFVINP